MIMIEFLKLFLLDFLFVAVPCQICWILCVKLPAKKCNYDCSKCKNWACEVHYCNKKREELNKETE